MSGSRQKTKMRLTTAGVYQEFSSGRLRPCSPQPRAQHILSEMSKRAVWYWQSDNGWVKYDDKICAELEIGLVAKQKRVRVDKDRYIHFLRCYHGSARCCTAIQQNSVYFHFPSL
jgi:hypothetical protein